MELKWFHSGEVGGWIVMHVCLISLFNST